VSLVPPNQAPGEEELEELGDEAIIAQQSVAHAPPAAAQVEEEKRSVVISDKPPVGGAAASGSQRPKSRGRGDATVVIRDRRKLEEMRREIRESQRAYAKRPSRPPRNYLFWGGAALAAFLVGGAVALALGAASSGPELAPLQVDPVAAEREKAKAAPEAAPAPTVNLEDLPVERRKR
jgi:hypothetical protein